MSKLAQKSTTPQSTTTKQLKYTYLGLSEFGRIRLQLKDNILHINGAVYVSTSPVVGSTKIVLVPVNTTPGYKREPDHKKYLAVTVTGEIFRIIGTVEKTLTAVAPIQKTTVRTVFNSTGNAPGSPTRSLTSPPKQATPTTGIAPAKLLQIEQVDTKKQSKLARLQKEFQRVTAQRASDIDPAVRIAFAAYYLGESESNLYRRRAEGQFPKSIQRGKGTFWLMSDLDAFKAGTWEPDTA